MNQKPGLEHRPRHAAPTVHSSERLWPAVADAAIACWTTDTELRFTAIDGAGFVQATGGASPGVVVGKTIAELLGPTHGPEVTVRVVAAFRAALAGETVSLELRAFRGGRWRIQLEPMRGETGETCGVVGIGLFDAADGARDDIRPPARVSARRRGVDVTAREWEVLERLRRGATTEDIAKRLWITPATVRSHVASLCRKLGVASRDDLLRVIQPAPAVDEISTASGRASSLR